MVWIYLIIDAFSYDDSNAPGGDAHILHPMEFLLKADWGSREENDYLLLPRAHSRKIHASAWHGGLAELYSGTPAPVQQPARQRREEGKTT